MQTNRAIPFPHSAWWALRLGLGLGPLLAGLDKFFNLLTDWGMYLSPWVERLLPISGGAFMRVVGVVEMIVGLAILTSWTRIGGYIAGIWLVAIAVNLMTTGMFFDLAVRDLEIAIGAYALARLTEAREAREERSPSLTGLPVHQRISAARVALVLLLLAVPAVSTAAVETWTNVALVDTQCAPKVKEDPDLHTTKCALQCARHGFGVITPDGTFLLLDEAGN